MRDPNFQGVPQTLLSGLVAQIRKVGYYRDHIQVRIIVAMQPNGIGKIDFKIQCQLHPLVSGLEHTVQLPELNPTPQVVDQGVKTEGAIPPRGQIIPGTVKMAWYLDGQPVSHSMDISRTVQEELHVKWQIRYDREYVDKHEWLSPALPYDIYVEMPSDHECEVVELLGYSNSSLDRKATSRAGELRFLHEKTLFPRQGFQWRIVRRPEATPTPDSHPRIGRTSREKTEDFESKPSTVNNLKILLLAADPQIGRKRLALDKEYRKIQDAIRDSKYRDSMELIVKYAARPQDLVQALYENSPHIVHFSGHGSDSSEILLLNEQDKSRPVDKAALSRFFGTRKGNIRLVLLNACFSRPQAQAITKHIDCAIGIPGPIEDDDAIDFAAEFYRAIGFGESIQSAFEHAKVNTLRVFPEEPVIVCRRGVDAGEITLVGSRGVIG
jgi:hypothetical protein